jgi:DNA-binding IclR family transcriptional regulator
MVKSDSASKGIQSIEQGYRLLEALEHSGGGLSLKDLAAAVGMSPSKAHFYLTSLVRVGLVSQAASGGHYEFGPAAIRFGMAALLQIDVTQLARSSMFDLREATGEAVFLSVWGSGGPTILSRVEGKRWSPLEIRVGATLKVLSATGRALIAWLPDNATDDLLQRGLDEATPRDKWYGMSVAQARGLLDVVRGDGYAVGSGTAVEGFHGVAAPIFDYEGATTAVITIVGNDKTFNTDADRAKLDALLDATKTISEKLGTPVPQRAAASQAIPVVKKMKGRNVI